MARPKRGIPWLVWRNGVAYAFWYDADRKETRRLSLHTRDEAEAKARFAAFLVEGGATPEEHAHGLTVADALDQYRREHVAVNCADPRRQEDAIVHLKGFFVDTLMSSIDIPMSRRYVEHRRAQPGKGRMVLREGYAGAGPKREKIETLTEMSTIARELRVLVAAANHAKKWKRLVDLPSVEQPQETRTGADDEAPYFTKTELGLLLDMADGELRHFIQLAYWTGARRASIEELTRAQVRWDAKRILLQRPGKRATKKRQPIVPILPEMEAPLRALWDAGRERLFSAVDFYRPFQRLCEGMGFGPERQHPHLLRHSRATHLLQDGVGLYAVARLLGDTVATVEKVYGHHSHEHLAGELGGK